MAIVYVLPSTSIFFWSNSMHVSDKLRCRGLCKATIINFKLGSGDNSKDTKIYGNISHMW
jgi:hypothetical protein